MTLDELIKELYEIKSAIRNRSKTYSMDMHRRELLRKKDMLLLTIKRELSKAGKTEREDIRSKLYEELGVII